MFPLTCMEVFLMSLKQNVPCIYLKINNVTSTQQHNNSSQVLTHRIQSIRSVHELQRRVSSVVSFLFVALRGHFVPALSLDQNQLLSVCSQKMWSNGAAAAASLSEPIAVVTFSFSHFFFFLVHFIWHWWRRNSDDEEKHTRKLKPHLDRIHFTFTCHF